MSEQSGDYMESLWRAGVGVSQDEYDAAMNEIHSQVQFAAGGKATSCAWCVTDQVRSPRALSFLVASLTKQGFRVLRTIVCDAPMEVLMQGGCPHHRRGNSCSGAECLVISWSGDGL
jgi:hypothetical protein